MSVKLSDVVSNFENVEKSGDVSDWLEKLELVARLQNVTQLETFVPLFLSGPAFAVYKQLSDLDKSDYANLKAKLIEAFGVDCYSAYTDLRERVLKDGESVDVFIADLRRLVALMGQTNPEPLLKCAFVSGLPADVSIQLKSTTAVESLELPELISRARIILSTRIPTSNLCAAGQITSARRLKCFECGSFDHIKRDCPKRVSEAPERKITCFGCGGTGHIKRLCPNVGTKESSSGNV